MTIAAISTALHEIIAAAVGQGVMGGAVRLGPPRPVEPGETEVNICFYRIEPNAAWRNRPMASRTGGGFASVETPSAFDLHYLIAFAGEELARQTMIADVLTALTARPVLGGEDAIRLTPEPLSLEDITRLWSAFQVPLRPSLHYVASPVVLEVGLSRGSSPLAP